MKTIKSLIILVILLFINLWGCTSSLYTIEEVEEVVQDDTNKHMDQKILTNTDTSEIKEDLKIDKIKENISDKQVVSKEYAIQIGAFSSESNAVNFLKKAKNTVKEDVYYKDVQGLYKVRVGNFNSKTEALGLLQKMIGSGFSDSFVVELTYVKVPE